MTDLEYANKRLTRIADRLRDAYISLFSHWTCITLAADAVIRDPSPTNLAALKNARNFGLKPDTQEE